MFINFLKVTIRNLYREKMYAIINIFGLSIAIVCCIILGLYLRSELTYDRHNTKYKQIYRIVNEVNTNGKIANAPYNSTVLGPMLAEEYPEIKGYVRFQGVFREELIRHEDKAFYWERIYYADANVFDVFTHHILYGDPKTALIDPSSCAVSSSFAKRYFGNSNPIGEIISNDSDTYKITLVFADLPENSHLKYDVLYSFNKKELASPDSVTVRNQALFNMNSFTYLLMPEGYNKQDFKKISDAFYARHMAEIASQYKTTWKAWLQPLADTHFQSEVGYDLPNGNIFYVYGFTAVALFILLVACINYMNLATARAAKRAKEVGMRKILGSGRVSLMLKFIGEAIFFAFIALFIGIIFVEIALDLMPINELLGISLTLNLTQEPVLIAWLLIFNLLIGLLSGIYPAFYLSSMLSLSSLVKDNRPGKGNIRLRELLVLVQFIISVAVIASALLMTLQMRYVSHKSLGFNKENKVIITLKGADLIHKMPTIKKEFLKNKDILGMATCNYVLGQIIALNIAEIENNDSVLEKTSLKNMSVGEDYIEVMGMQLVTGRDFSKKLLTDVGTSFIVNEAVVKKMGWKEPLGKRINIGLSNGRVIGVVKDFHFASLHSPVEPFAMHKMSFGDNTPSEEERKKISILLVINISGKEVSRTLAFLQDKFAEFGPVHPLNYKFLDETLDQLYLSEQRLMKLIGIFAGVCILISCMGLFGLAAFTTEQRTKEIGIRKVLGASTWQIIVMLASRILVLVLVGAAVASLISYYAMDKFLAGFAYRIGINPLVFLVSAGIAAFVAFITVALQSYKTAMANPVNALRYE